MSRRLRDQGTVYLLHFIDPATGESARYRHAGHYTGWALDLAARLARHEDGRGARLLEVIRDAGLGWKLARTWPGDRNRERQLKNQGGASRHCPECGVRPRTGQRRAREAPEPAASARRPEPPAALPEPARPPACERGAAMAARRVQEQIDAGFSADRIEIGRASCRERV